MDCYLIFSGVKNSGTFGAQINTERQRLMKWKTTWALRSGQGTKEYRYRYATATLARIVSLFTSPSNLRENYGIKVTETSFRDKRGIKRKHPRELISVVDPTRSHQDLTDSLNNESRAKSNRPDRSSPPRGLSTPSKGLSGLLSLDPLSLDDLEIRTPQNLLVLENINVVPGLAEELVRLQEATTRFQQVLPVYRKFQWTVVDKDKTDKLTEKLRSYNDRLVKARYDPVWKIPITPTQLPLSPSGCAYRKGDFLEKMHGILISETKATDNQTDRLKSMPRRRTAILHHLLPVKSQVSQVSKEYAYRYSSFYTAVFWVDATSQESLARSVLEMAERIVSYYATKWENSNPDFTEIGIMAGLFGLVEPSGKVRSNLVIKAMRNWLGSPENRDWLVIIDNHNRSSVNLGDFLPICDFGNIIIDQGFGGINPILWFSRDWVMGNQRRWFRLGLAQYESVHEVHRIPENLTPFFEYINFGDNKRVIDRFWYLQPDLFTFRGFNQSLDLRDAVSPTMQVPVVFSNSDYSTTLGI